LREYKKGVKEEGAFGEAVESLKDLDESLRGAQLEDLHQRWCQALIVSPLTSALRTSLIVLSFFCFKLVR
jgi:hypothetical protein